MTGKSPAKSKGLMHYNRLHHYLIYENDDNELLHQEPREVFIEHPYPINTTLTTLPGLDRYEELLEQKKRYLKELDTCRRLFARDKKRLLHKKFQKDKFAVLPQYVVDMTQNKSSDPDTYFADDSNYNWYYTGGLLQCIEANDTDLLIRINHQNNLVVSDINEISEHNVNLNKNHRIYAINGLSLGDNSFLISLRAKHKVYISTINANETDTFEVNLTNRQTSEIPFVDLKLNHTTKNTFCTLLANNYLKVYDINHEKAIYKYHFAEDFNQIASFGQAEFLNQNELVILNRSEIYLSDKRQANVSQASLNLNDCDEMCTFCVRDENTLYTANRHSFMKYDLRNFKTVYKYSHMLELPPFLITCEKMNGIDYICLANQHTKVLLSDDSSMYSLPLQIPSVLDTYTESQLKDFQIHKNAEKRLRMSTIGLHLRRGASTKDLILYSSTSADDLFKQKISHKLITSEASERMTNWIKNLPIQKTKIVATSIAEMSSVRFLLNKAVKTQRLERMEKSGKVPFKNVTALYEGQDNFGTHLEEIWLADEDEVSEEGFVPEIHTKDKVSAWLSTQFDE